MTNKFVALSGLPRSGSTLLASILSENDSFYVEGTSGLCQILWDINNSFDVSANQVFLASGTYYRKDRVIRSIVDSYYAEAKNKVIIDKNRNWTKSGNLNIYQRYIDSNPKIIVTIRPIEEIVKSFIYLNNLSKSDQKKYENYLFDENNGLIFDPLSGIFDIVYNPDIKPLFIRYDDLILDTKNQIDRVYNFLNLESFNHNLSNIQKRWKEDDDVYNLPGLHDVRSEIQKRVYNIELSRKILEKCKMIDERLEDLINGFFC